MQPEEEAAVRAALAHLLQRERRRWRSYLAVAVGAALIGGAAGVWTTRATPVPTYVVAAAPGRSPFLLPPEPGPVRPTGRIDRFALTAAPAVWHIYPGQDVSAWLFSGGPAGPAGPAGAAGAGGGVSPGPALTVTEGDTVEATVTNHLPEPLTVSFPTDRYAEAGIPGLSQGPVWPGQSFTYRFTAPRAGTYEYESTFDPLREVNFGLYGAFIVHRQRPPSEAARFDVDRTVVVGEWPSPGDYDAREATYFTLNGHSYPATAPIQVRRGDRVRLRLINAGAMMWHVFELQGHSLWLIARDGVPLASPEPAGTVALGPGQTADVAFLADNPGNWPLLCNVLDHQMNLDQPGPGGLQLLVRYRGFTGGLPPAANELAIIEDDLWQAQAALTAGGRPAAQADYGRFVARWRRVGRDVERVDPSDALRLDQLLALTGPAWTSDPRYLPTALQSLDDQVVGTVNAINGSRVGMPQPGP